MSDRLFIKEISLSGEIPRDSYVSGLSIVRHLKNEPLKLSSPVTVFTGENGVGKSTLIEAVAVAFGFNAEGGTKNFSFSTRESHSPLADSIRLAKSFRRPRDGYFLRAESFFNVATHIEQLDSEPGGPPIINSYGGVSLHEQSHGESFIALVQNRFRGEGLYILDEPEAALSPMRTLTLMRLIHDLVNDGSQFIISTHSPMLMAFPEAEVFEMTFDSVSSVPYWQTEHYSVTRRFLLDPQGILKVLME